MKRVTLLPLLLVCFVINPYKAKTQAVNVQDSIALVNLYDSTNGNAWTTHFYWRTSTPVKNWKGVTVRGGRVTKLILPGNKLAGLLPTSLGNLTAIQYIDFSKNSLGGTIPAGFGNFTLLQYLDLSNNGLSGSIPTALGNLAALQTLMLGFNGLTGVIPASIGKLVNLQTLQLDDNRLSGSMPGELGNLVNLQTLTIPNNQLTGNIPEELGNLASLVRLDAHRNLFTGSIPASFGNLVKVKYIILSNCHLSGSLPATLNNLVILQFLYINSNQLSGTFPTMNNVKGCTEVINNNRFTFDGFEQNFVARHGKYYPQATIPLIQNGDKLSVNAGGTLANDTFRLYKNGGLIATQVGDSVFTIAETGNYSIATTNSIATVLTLHSDTVNITTLPLTILNFTAAVKNAATLLQWQTANEVNTSRFIVQRSNGSMFTPIATVNAANANNNHTNTYNFTDASPLQGVNIYRLKMIDKDGAFTYSKTIAITIQKATGGLNVYPNLVHSNATVTFNGNAGKYTLTISNSNGGRVKQLTGFAAQGTNNIPVDMSNFAKGMYIVTIDNGKDKYSVKVVKE